MKPEKYSSQARRIMKMYDLIPRAKVFCFFENGRLNRGLQSTHKHPAARKVSMMLRMNNRAKQALGFLE